MKSIPPSPNRILSSLLVVLAAACLAVPARAETKIAVVNLSKVGEGYWKMKQANAQIQERKADFDKTRKGLLEDGQKATEEYTKLVAAASDQALSADERDKRKVSAEKKLREINEIKQSIDQFDRTSYTTLTDLQRRTQERILDEVKEVVAAQAKAGGFSVVLDTALLLYSNSDNELTDAVLKELNSRRPIDLPGTDSKDGKKDEKVDEKK
jgi:outer membrane protein